MDAVVAAGTAMPYVESGRLRVLGWLNDASHPDYPEVKTLKELGYDVEAYAVVGLGGPKDMDLELAKKISGIFQDILNEPEMRKYLLDIFQHAETSSPEAFQAWAEQQLDKERVTLQEFGLLDAARL